jgi:hypothetical protein
MMLCYKSDPVMLAVGVDQHVSTMVSGLVMLCDKSDPVTI